MSSSISCFIPFNVDISGYQLPETFTYPYHYQPHPLSLCAVTQLQHYLKTQSDWQHDFGLGDKSTNPIGKMFGVLVVKDSQNRLGFISAFSGKLANSNHVANFVPPVYDMLVDEGFFLLKQAEINQLNQRILMIEQSSELMALNRQYDVLTQQAQQEITVYRQRIINARKRRKSERIMAESQLSADARNVLNDRLNSQSVYQKNTLKLIIRYWESKLAEINQQREQFIQQCVDLKNQRKNASRQLQTWLFSQYKFINQYGEKKDLEALFEPTVYSVPPAGAGECAAPKLLQYAFLNGLTPLAMAEFWWGASPISEVRQHGQFYGACQGKCKPILDHMLLGIAIEQNPLLANIAKDKQIEIVYQDKVMVIINKPPELLSVPGKHISDCVYSRMKALFPDATGPLIVHRLDMSTSGLMVIALTKKANEFLQKQFISRLVKKRYVALLSGSLADESGYISLPLRVDFDDRPRQLVCYEQGKKAETKWQLVETKQGKSKVYFYPKTGRTHQLRVHSAHVLGLNMPICGDDLYGQKADRLYLHAEQLTLKHPVTNQTMTFQVDADF